VLPPHQATFEAKGGKIEVIPPIEPMTLRADFTGAYIMLDRVLHNAVSASPSHGTIRLWTEAADTSLILYVQDEGAGVALTDVSLIFNRYFHGATSPGLGLGLYVAREVAQKMSGSIQHLTPSNGQGACFRLVWLKATPAPVSIA
jgi:signal transduction histidine kinase